MNKERQATIETVAEYILTNCQYGDTIEFRTLERLLNCEREEIVFSYLMSALKNYLIEFGVILTGVIQIGYRILNPNEVAREVYKKNIKQSVNKLAKGIFIMSNIDESVLTEEEKKQFNEIQKLVLEMHKTSENSMLKAQFIFGEKQRNKQIN